MCHSSIVIEKSLISWHDCRHFVFFSSGGEYSPIRRWTLSFNWNRYKIKVLGYILCGFLPDWLLGCGGWLPNGFTSGENGWTLALVTSSILIRCMLQRFHVAKRNVYFNYQHTIVSTRRCHTHTHTCSAGHIFRRSHCLRGFLSLGQWPNSNSALYPCCLWYGQHM